MKIAILGGSFDPIHNAHLSIAKYALKQSDIQEVWFIPTYHKTPLKTRKLSDYEHRLKMIQLAIQPYRKMKCSTIEKELNGDSYTIDTVKALQKKYPQHTFVWLIGSDQANQLHLWKDIDELFKLVEFRLFLRQSDKLDSKYDLEKIEMPYYNISSTEIRNGNFNHIPESVKNYIGKHYLYLETSIPNLMSERRWKHSQSVADLCKELATVHQIDEQIAYVTGLTHDVCKEMDYDTAKKLMEVYYPEFIYKHPAIWHGYLGEYYLKHHFHIYDKNILKAVRNHVEGLDKSPLSMIVYIADKLDPTRGYDVSEKIELSKRDLKKGYSRVKNEQSEYLKKEKSE